MAQLVDQFAVSLTVKLNNQPAANSAHLLTSVKTDFLGALGGFAGKTQADLENIVAVIYTKTIGGPIFQVPICARFKNRA